MMFYIVIGFLWISFLFYLILGGADFGAGILEIFTKETNKYDLRKTAHLAIGPIWEANHMWLIIAIVILFVGFPDVYATVSIYLHIPVLIMLLGIIARGTAFTFRNYDAVNDKMQRLYTHIYVYSSFITPLFLGIIAAAAVSGRIATKTQSFSEAYIFDWLDWFPVFVGFFTVFLCGYLSAIFLAGEVSGNPSRQVFAQKARLMNLGGFIFLFLSFRAANAEKIPVYQWIFGSTISVIAVVVSFIAWMLTWYQFTNDNAKLTRLTAGVLMVSLLVAMTYGHFPDMVRFRDGTALSLKSARAPEETINTLGIALLSGSIFILPSLAYLIYSFGRKNNSIAT